MIEPRDTRAAVVLFTADSALYGKQLDSDPQKARALARALRLGLAEVVGQCRAPAEVVLATDGAASPELRLRLEASRGTSHIHEIRQSGHGFGERLIGSARAAASLGCGRLVLVGDDTPDMSARALDEAIESPDIVIGPSADGGFYLLGLDASHLHLLRDIPWQTSGVLDAIVGAARAAGLSVRVLETRVDIDSALAAKNAATTLGALISRLFPTAHRTPPAASPPDRLGFVPAHMLALDTISPRGPPGSAQVR